MYIIAQVVLEYEFEKLHPSFNTKSVYRMYLTLPEYNSLTTRRNSPFNFFNDWKILIDRFDS